MTFTDYLLDSLLVALVILQLRESELTTKLLVRPLIIVGVAVMSYLHGIPSAGNDLVLTVALGLLGSLIGFGSGAAAIMRVRSDGAVTVRAGWASAVLWVAGMGSRFAFVWWITHSGAHALAGFSAAHAITSGEAWTVALLAMALCEVAGRTAVLAARRRHLQQTPAAAIA